MKSITSTAPECVQDWCAGCDYIVNQKDMSWTDNGEWRCSTCNPVTFESPPIAALWSHPPDETRGDLARAVQRALQPLQLIQETRDGVTIRYHEPQATPHEFGTADLR